MAVLHIYSHEHRRVETQVEVQGATSMAYAAMHVAEACGFDSEDGWRLATKGGQPIDPGDVAAQWDGLEVVLHSHGGRT